MQQQKKLYRSRYDSVIAGVAGGLGKYLDVDPLIIRILFVIFTLFGFGGLIVYVILWIAIPLDPDYTYYSYYQKTNVNMEDQNSHSGSSTGDKSWQDYPKPRNDGNLIAGVLLITLGAMFLADRFIPRIDFGDLWPVLLIAAGIIIMKNSISKPKNYRS